MNHYNNRVLESSIWNSKDISLYDLTTSGAEELNSQTDLSPDTYYYTYSGQTTKADALGFQAPVLSTTPVLRLTAQYIGHAGNSQWWANDGAVPVISGEYPLNQAHVKDSHTVDQPGIWQYNEPIQGWDILISHY
ncbi:lipase [Lactobacillus terrae]|uniref:lipase-like domain-containing protein n=1 Tax=Lactobacillus terrae TaxID=2269374 RepID=UPI003CCBF35A